MNILAVEASTESLSTALMAQGKVFVYRSKLKSSHDEILLPAVARLMRRAKLKMEDLDAVAASNGPGRFTGIRIGMAYAAVAAAQLKIPALAVSRFEAVAFKSQAPLVCAMIVGFREEKFYQLFGRRAGGTPKAQSKPLWVSPEQWASDKKALESRGAAVESAETSALDLLAPAERWLKSGKLPKFEPLYLKPAGFLLGKK